MAAKQQQFSVKMKDESDYLAQLNCFFVHRELLAKQGSTHSDWESSKQKYRDSSGFVLVLFGSILRWLYCRFLLPGCGTRIHTESARMQLQ